MNIKKYADSIYNSYKDSTMKKPDSSYKHGRNKALKGKKLLKQEFIKDINIPERITSGSSDATVRSILGKHSLSSEACKIVKRNTKFFVPTGSRSRLSENKFLDILQTMDKLFPLKVKKVKNLKSFVEMLNESSGLYVSPAAIVIILELGYNDQYVYQIKALYQGASVKDIIMSIIHRKKLDLSKKQFKKLINSKKTSALEIIYESMVSKNAAQVLVNKSAHILTYIRNNKIDYKVFFNIIEKLVSDYSTNKVVDCIDFITTLDREEIAELSKVGSRRIMEESDIWHDQQAMLKVSNIKNRTWENKGFSCPQLEVKTLQNNPDVIEKEFFVEELNSAKELAEEGRLQSHCVYSYISKCASGCCTVVSLRVNEFETIKSLVTIEIVGNKIVQARRKANMNPTAYEHNLIKKYADKFNLRCDYVF